MKNDVVFYPNGRFVMYYLSLTNQNTTNLPTLGIENNFAWKTINHSSYLSKNVSVTEATLTTPKLFIPFIQTSSTSEIQQLHKNDNIYVSYNRLYDGRGLLATDSSLVPIWSALDHLNLNKTDETDFEEHKTSPEAHQELFNLKANKENWRLIRADTITNPVTSMLFNTDSEGNPFKIKDILIIQSNWQTATASTANGGVNVNNTTNRVFYNQMGSVSGAANLVRNIHIERLGNYYKGSAWYGTPNSTSVGTLQAMPTMLYLADEAVTSIYMSFASAIATGSFEIWGLDV